MNLDGGDILKQALILLMPGIPAITLHECAHGWMALCFGDTTARDARRLSLNPLRHIDPMGTIILPGLMLLTHMPFIFGWAKPVPVDFRRLRNGHLGIFLVALAGPLANFLMMIGWLMLAGLIGNGTGISETVPDNMRELAAQIALFGVSINLVLMLFNLIPVPPLDGGRIVGAMLPDALSQSYMRLERYGLPILLLLIVSGAFRLIFEPVLNFFFFHMGVM